MTTYFVRHTEKLVIDASTRDRIWDERRIAIHFPEHANGGRGETDNTSLDPNDYADQESRQSVRALVTLAREGGYVCAEHLAEHPRRERVQVGWVSPGSAVDLLEGRWALDLPPRTAILKTIRLKRAQPLEAADAAVALVGRPRRGTIRCWHLCKNRIQDIVDGIKRELALGDLMPYEQETMCAEFLRMPEALQLGLPRLAHLLLPVGRTMKDVDIIGIGSDGRKILCQVTFFNEVESSEKLKSLKSFSGGDNHRPIFFCNTTSFLDCDDVYLVPLQKIFDSFKATTSGRLWLSALRPSIK